MTKPQPRLTDSELASELLTRGKNVGKPARGSMGRTIARVEAAASAGLLVGGAGLGIAEAAAQSTVIAGSSALKSVGSWLVTQWFVSGMVVGIAGGGVVTGVVVATQVRQAASSRPAVVASGTVTNPLRSVRSGSKSELASPIVPAAASSLGLESSGLSSSGPDGSGPDGSGPDGSGPDGSKVDEVPSSSDVYRRSVADAAKRKSEPISPELARELGMLDGARAAVERGERAEALRRLDQHDRQFPNGQLVPEAILLRQRAESLERSTNQRRDE